MENRGPLHFGFWNVDFGLNLIEFLIGIRGKLGHRSSQVNA